MTCSPVCSGCAGRPALASASLRSKVHFFCSIAALPRGRTALRQLLPRTTLAGPERLQVGRPLARCARTLAGPVYDRFGQGCSAAFQFARKTASLPREISPQHACSVSFGLPRQACGLSTSVSTGTIALQRLLHLGTITPAWRARPGSRRYGIGMLREVQREGLRIARRRLIDRKPAGRFGHNISRYEASPRTLRTVSAQKWAETRIRQVLNWT